MDKLRVGIIGLGVGSKHLAAYLAYTGCEVVALCDLDKTKLESHKALAPKARLTTDADDVLNDPQINVISIASYDNFHATQAIQALRHGKHVFIEKPLCLTRTEAQEILAALSENPTLKLSSNLNLRSVPRFVWLKNQLASGAFGQLSLMEGDYFWSRPEKLENGWRSKMDYYSIVLGAAVHMVDLLRWLQPDDEIRQVYAVGNRLATATSANPFNDCVLVSLEFASGLIAKVSAQAASVTPHFHRLALYGTKATFIQDPQASGIFRTREGAVEPVTAEYPGHEKAQIITSFLDSLKDAKKLPLVSTEDVFATMAVCFAADESMKTGQPVVVQPLTADKVRS